MASAVGVLSVVGAAGRAVSSGLTTAFADLREMDASNAACAGSRRRTPTKPAPANTAIIAAQPYFRTRRMRRSAPTRCRASEAAAAARSRSRWPRAAPAPAGGEAAPGAAARAAPAPRAGGGLRSGSRARAGAARWRAGRLGLGSAPGASARHGAALVRGPISGRRLDRRHAPHRRAAAAPSISTEAIRRSASSRNSRTSRSRSPHDEHEARWA